jgi:peptidyl-prolyl cis-trans isomerase D
MLWPRSATNPSPWLKFTTASIRFVAAIRSPTNWRLYARQISQSTVFQKESVRSEASRRTVSDQERSDRIRQYLPTVYNGGTFVGIDTYAREVQTRFQMSVPAFEQAVKDGLVEEKFRKLLTDGISVSPAEIQEESRVQNEKIKLDYVLIKPEDLAAKLTLDNEQIKAYFEQNRSKYQIPEKRIVRYALVDINQLRQDTTVTDDELKAIYQQNIQDYQVKNRVHPEHILLFTKGKTDAEVVEIKKKAEDLLAQAKKKGANFEELAKKYSEDPGSKAKNGDLGWIEPGQTVPN